MALDGAGEYTVATGIITNEEWDAIPTVKKLCTVEGCERPARGKGLCGMHYARQRKHGDALHQVRPWSPRSGNGQVEDGGWRAFEQARAYVRSLNMISSSVYRTWARTGECPTDIPARPDWVYKDQGWSGWGDWLREVPVKSPGSRLRRAAALVPTGIVPAPDRPVHIYGLTEPDQPSNIRYVGQVWQPPGWSADEALRKRLSEHIALAEKTKGSANHRINWLKSVLRQEQTPGIVLIETATVEKGDEREIFQIAAYRAAGFDLTNNGDGGGTNRGKKIGPAWNKGRKTPEEQVAKHRGRKRSPETCERISVSQKGKKQTLEHVAKRIATTKVTAPDRGAHIASANRGKKRTPEQRERMRAARAKSGHIATPETRAKISEAGRGRIPWNKGQKGVSSETRAKMRTSHLGKEPANKGKTHCVHGHEYTPENTYINNKGARVCKTCKQIAYQERQARLRDEREKL